MVELTPIPDRRNKSLFIGIVLAVVAILVSLYFAFAAKADDATFTAPIARAAISGIRVERVEFDSTRVDVLASLMDESGNKVESVRYTITNTPEQPARVWTAIQTITTLRAGESAPLSPGKLNKRVILALYNAGELSGIAAP
jgi:hypothetical protein